MGWNRRGNCPKHFGTDAELFGEFVWVDGEFVYGEREFRFVDVDEEIFALSPKFAAKISPEKFNPPPLKWAITMTRPTKMTTNQQGTLTHQCHVCDQIFQGKACEYPALTRQVQKHYRFRHKQIVENPDYTLPQTIRNPCGRNRALQRSTGINYSAL
jgi:hypothetical protein